MIFLAWRDEHEFIFITDGSTHGYVTVEKSTGQQNQAKSITMILIDPIIVIPVLADVIV